jgi:hypothetical protein
VWLCDELPDAALAVTAALALEDWTVAPDAEVVVVDAVVVDEAVVVVVVVVVVPKILPSACFDWIVLLGWTLTTLDNL